MLTLTNVEKNYIILENLFYILRRTVICRVVLFAVTYAGIIGVTTTAEKLLWVTLIIVLVSR